MVKVAIIGGSGYTGLELLRLFAGHPDVKVVAVTSRSEAGRPVAGRFPALAGVCDLAFVQPDDPSIGQAEFVFLALPHKAAMETGVKLIEAGQRVIDLSADFRFRDAKNYEAHYCPHIAPELTAQAVYGLPEVYREQIKSAQIIGNPGCYPTCSLLPLIPLLKEGFIEPEGIIIDAKSGVSGAGRAAAVSSLFSEAGEDFKAYNVASHRHQPEIEQELSLASGAPVKVVFTPHLTPLSRGMLATIYAKPAVGLEKVLGCWRDFYAGSPFVRVLDSGLPRTVTVRGSNMCHLAAAMDESAGCLILLSAIDNLTKGASGQAIQCFNLMAGLEETLGLPLAGLMP